VSAYFGASAGSEPILQPRGSEVRLVIVVAAGCHVFVVKEPVTQSEPQIRRQTAHQRRRDAVFLSFSAVVQN